MVQLFVGILANVPTGQLATHILVEESAYSPVEQINSHFFVIESAKSPFGQF